MKKIVVIGGGESGYGSAVLAKTKGFDVFVTDSGPIAEKYRKVLEEYAIPYEEGGHAMERVLEADEAVKSPGVPDTAPVVRALREKGVAVISEIEFAGRYLDGARTICITGSNGKTTTTTLIYRILRDAGYDVALGGNIGESFAYSVATGRHDWYVLELSSFQLDGMTQFRADIAVLMNITPDHLDRYDYNMQKYTDSKMRIVQNQRPQDMFIYMGDDEVIAAEVKKRAPKMQLAPFTYVVGDAGRDEKPLTGAFTDGVSIEAFAAGRSLQIEADGLKIRGRHNLYNAMAAMLAALEAGVDERSIVRTLGAFEGVEHRLEPAGEAEGVLWINDSKATNVDSAWYALDAMTRPVVWIAGGTDKGNDYSALADLARRKVKTLVCMGADNSKLVGFFSGIVPQVIDTGSLDEAMAAAAAATTAGDVVLLSPACASFDLFRNYEDRGRQFKEWVRRHKLIKPSASTKVGLAKKTKA